jgi:hypothetical protein
MSTASEQFRSRGLCGWYVVMGLTPGGRGVPGLAAHSTTCYVPHQDRSGDYPFGPVAVEEIPPGTQPCGHCGGGALPKWLAGQRPS